MKRTLMDEASMQAVEYALLMCSILGSNHPFQQCGFFEQDAVASK
jgi:hypothetical protein